MVSFRDRYTQPQSTSILFLKHKKIYFQATMTILATLIYLKKIGNTGLKNTKYGYLRFTTNSHQKFTSEVSVPL